MVSGFNHCVATSPFTGDHPGEARIDKKYVDMAIANGKPLAVTINGYEYIFHRRASVGNHSYAFESDSYIMFEDGSIVATKYSVNKNVSDIIGSTIPYGNIKVTFNAFRKVCTLPITIIFVDGFITSSFWRRGDGSDQAFITENSILNNYFYLSYFDGTGIGFEAIYPHESDS